MANAVPGWASGLWDALQTQIGLLSTVQSQFNSTFNPLPANGVFTGPAEDITKYAEVRISVFASHASATDGLLIEQSVDGINWDQSDAYTVPAATNKSFGVGAVMKYFRIVYTNGVTAQTAFRMTVKYNITLTKASSVRMADARSLQNDFEEVAAYNANYNGSTFDLMRSVVNSTDSTGTGITAAGLLAQFDDTSPSAVTENQFANVRMNKNRVLYVEEGPFIAGRVTADGQIKGSAGFVHTISIAGLTATPTAGLLTVYDSLTETGTVLYSEWVFATDVGHTITLDLPFATGLFIGYDATLTNVQVAVSYR